MGFSQFPNASALDKSPRNGGQVNSGLLTAAHHHPALRNIVVATEF
jgi:hypothetical protein